MKYDVMVANALELHTKDKYADDVFANLLSGAIAVFGDKNDNTFTDGGTASDYVSKGITMMVNQAKSGLFRNSGHINARSLNYTAGVYKGAMPKTVFIGKNDATTPTYSFNMSADGSSTLVAGTDYVVWISKPADILARVKKSLYTFSHRVLASESPASVIDDIVNQINAKSDVLGVTASITTAIAIDDGGIKIVGEAGVNFNVSINSAFNPVVNPTVGTASDSGTDVTTYGTVNGKTFAGYPVVTGSTYTEFAVGSGLPEQVMAAEKRSWVEDGQTGTSTTAYKESWSKETEVDADATYSSIFLSWVDPRSNVTSDKETYEQQLRLFFKDTSTAVTNEAVDAANVVGSRVLLAHVPIEGTVVVSGATEGTDFTIDYVTGIFTALTATGYGSLTLDYSYPSPSAAYTAVEALLAKVKAL